MRDSQVHAVFTRSCARSLTRSYPRGYLRWLPVILLLLRSAAAYAQGRIDCNALESHVLRESVRYCVLLPPGYDNRSREPNPRHYPVLYLLHGLGDNEQTLFQGAGWDVIEELRRRGEISDFLIVVPQGKRGFYINSADGRVRYSDFFMREFIPYIESHYSIRRERSGRAISGVSMGGYGALRFAFAYPEMFSSVSAESAALIAASPHSIESEIDRNAPTQLDGILGPVFGNPIDGSHWNRNSPFVLARENRARIRAAKLAIYFNCGDEDDFGFNDGAAALDRQLRSEGIAHEFHLYPGNHSAAYFLTYLGEVLKFHSRAFAAGKS